MLSKKVIQSIILLSFPFFATSQTAQNMGMPINSQIASEYNPSLTGNGRTMIFISTTGQDDQPELVMSHAQSGVWSRPETVPNMTSPTGKMLYQTSDYNISYDGNTILFSVGKYGGVGGTDIWMMDKNGNSWSPPVNPGKPVNSTGNEADPSLSPDGRHLYFVRHTGKKTSSGLPCGKIYISEKVGNMWKEPKELPAPINTGNESSPRILADNQTLIFSSARAGGKGGFDLYKTQLGADGKWSAPVPLTIINTDKDDQYVSIPASGDFIYFTGPAKKGTDLFRMKLPDDLKPKKVMLIEGVVKDGTSNKPVSGRVVAYDLKKNNIYSIVQTNHDGSYSMYLTEGTDYDFSVNSNDKTHTFYSKYIDLNNFPKFEEVRTDVNLETVKSGSVIVLSNIAFDNKYSQVLNRSAFELGRIQKLLQDNPNVKVEIAAYTDEVVSDSLPSEQLTEVIIDSVDIADPEDSTGVRMIKIAKKTYHNDHTQREANLVADTLIKKGIPHERVKAKGYGDTQPINKNNDIQDKVSDRRIELIIK